MAVKKPTKKAAKKAARKPAYASQRAFRMFADDCTDHLALHTEQLKELDAKRLQQYRQHEMRLAEHSARLDAQQERLRQALSGTKAEELEATVRAVCKSEIMAHMQRLLGAERWKEMMAAPAVVVNATAETILTPLRPKHGPWFGPAPSALAKLLREAAEKIRSIERDRLAMLGHKYVVTRLEQDLITEATRLEETEDGG